MEIKTPIQHTAFGRIVKAVLKTRIGGWIGYHLRIRGFNKLEVTIRRANGRIERMRPAYNARVNAGAGLVAFLLSNNNLASLTSPTFPLYIANSANSLTPAAGDTTLSGEISANGLGRALGTAGTYTAPAALDGGASYVLSKTFTATGTQTVQSSGIFDAVSTGNLFAEANFSSSATLNNGDQLTVQWTVNF